MLLFFEMYNICMSEIMDMKDGIDKHFLYGIHYKIPLCCILHFISALDDLDESVPEIHDGQTMLWENHFGEDGYVMCPECLQRALKYIE